MDFTGVWEAGRAFWPTVNQFQTLFSPAELTLVDLYSDLSYALLALTGGLVITYHFFLVRPFGFI